MFIRIENKEGKLCDHGCGNIAHYSSSSGRLCCSETFYKCPGYKARQARDTKNRPPTIPKGTILKPKIYHPGKCEVCGEDHDGTYGSGKYCCESCARKASSLKCDRKSKNRKISQTLRSKSKEDKKRSYLIGIQTRKKNHPNIIRNTKIKRCRICGQENCIFPEICNHMKHLKLSQYSSIMNLEKLGTIDIYQEYNNFGRLLYDMYINQKLSVLDIQKKLKFKNFVTIYFLLQKFNIPVRDHIECSLNSWLMKTDNMLHKCTNTYHCGYHSSWEGKKFWYRSSYELDYAKELDEKKIRYEVESIRLPYYSKLKGRMAFMVTDFYLPDSNTVVEIKGDFTYVKEDVAEKFLALKEKGYNCKLILEKIEYNLENLPDTKLNRNISNYWSSESDLH